MFERGGRRGCKGDCGFEGGRVGRFDCERGWRENVPDRRVQVDVHGAVEWGFAFAGGWRNQDGEGRVVRKHFAGVDQPDVSPVGVARQVGADEALEGESPC